MALLPFAKPADLQILAPSIDDASAELLLDLVSGVIRSAIGWDVDEVADRVYTQTIRPCNYLEAVVLPALNLTGITSIVVDGVTLTAGQWDATPAGVVYLKGVLASESVVVTYTAGYPRSPRDDAPPALRAIALDYAMRWASNPSGVKQYSMGGTSETFESDIRTLADSDERLDPFRVNL